MDNIKDIVHQVIDRLSIRQPDEHNRIERIWRNILEKQELGHLKIDKFSNGNLLVHVDSPAWMHQMNQKKYVILERMKQEIPEIKSISFKIACLPARQGKVE